MRVPSELWSHARSFTLLTGAEAPKSSFLTALSSWSLCPLSFLINLKSRYGGKSSSHQNEAGKVWLDVLVRP